MMRHAQNLLLCATASLVALLLLEGLFAWAVNRGSLDINEPTYSLGNVGSRFWADINPDFGVWHAPHATYRHLRSCFDVTYEANSYGARDVERTKDETRPRVVVLGDSVMEGYGVALEARLSTLLERDTHIEHLNFATAGFVGPTQYYLVYKTLAKQFAHDAVMVGIFPNNDFVDDDYEFGKKVHRHRYRPYLIGAYPAYQLIHFRPRLDGNGTKGRAKKTLQEINGLLREFSYTYNALTLVRGSPSERPEHTTMTHKAASYSGYYEFTDEQFDRMRYVIEQIVVEAGGRAVSVVTTPRLADFQWYAVAGKPPLARRLRALCARLGVTYVDLLPYMYRHTRDWKSYYLPCDGHWNEYGNAVAAAYLRRHLSMYTGWAE